MNDEKRLFRVVNKGCEQEIEEFYLYLYNKYKNLLVFVASRYLDNTEDVKDIVQDTFIEFFNNTNKKHTNIKSFLTISCMHNALDYLKKKKRIDIIDIEDIDLYGNDEIKPHESYSEIVADLKNYLNEEEINIVLSHLLYGYDFNNLSKTLKKNVNSVKSIYYRSIKKYRVAKGIDKK